MVNRISRYINTDADPITSVGPGHVVIMQCAISELYWHFCNMPKHSARDLAHINNFNHSKNQHTMDSFNKENEDPSLSSSKSNFKEYMMLWGPMKHYRYLNTINIHLKLLLLSFQIVLRWSHQMMWRCIAHTYISHTHVTPCDVHPFC